MELLFDVDVKARAVADELGMRLERPPALNDDPVFIEALAELVRGRSGVKVVVVGGGIAGLAAARRARVESSPRPRSSSSRERERLGGKLLTEHVDGFVIEGGADSFLSRKARGVGLVRGARACGRARRAEAGERAGAS